MKSVVVRNEMATARLVILSAGHAPLLARELGWAHATESVVKSRSLGLRCYRLPFRDDVKADNVTDRVEIITRLSNLMNCTLHENGAQAPPKRAEDGGRRERDNCTILLLQPALRLARTR